MQKDVIYIDVEDDITAIIGKIKESKGKIVALVPPKRVGAIQSAVNLKLVHRATEQADKRLVLVTSNQALVALAGAAGIATAKTLQSRPEIPEIAALELDEGDEVIDGSELTGVPKSKVSKVPPKSAAASVLAAAGSSLDEEVGADEIESIDLESDDGNEASISSVASKKRTRDTLKVPDFNTVRKRLFLGVLLLGLLIGFGVWAFVFAPKARIVITAKTSDLALASRVNLAPSVATSLKSGAIKADQKSYKKDVSATIDATGKKDVGEKASGSVKLYNDSFSAITVSGVVTAGGFNFSLTAPVTIPGGLCSSVSKCTPGSASGSITASAPGSNANGVTGSLGSLPEDVTGSLSSATTGGTDKTVAVVRQSDIDAASDQLNPEAQSDAAKAELKKQFGADVVVLDATFAASASSATSKPAVGEEAPDGKATLTGSVTYSMMAVPKSEISVYLNQYFTQQIDGKISQKVYDNGLASVTFTNINGKSNEYAANISTNGKIGPVIDEQKTREFAKGKTYGEIQAEVESIDGVESADVKLSPFWVRKAPGDIARISVEFQVNGK